MPALLFLLGFLTSIGTLSMTEAFAAERQDFDELWDYGKAADTETRFREILPRARESEDQEYLAQLFPHPGVRSQLTLQVALPFPAPTTGFPGIQVPVEDTVRSFKGVIDGEYDHLPEAAFYMVGSIDDAIEKAAKLAAEAA